MTNTNTNELQSIDINDLNDVTGGNAVTAGLKAGAKVAGKVGSKAIPWVGAASTAYDVYKGGRAAYDSYQKGNGVAGAAWDGVKGFAKSFVGMD
jgi:hypothetical protein